MDNLSEVFTAVSLGTEGRKTQNTIEAVQCLNSSFLIDAKSSRVLRVFEGSPMISAALVSNSGSLEKTQGSIRCG